MIDFYNKNKIWLQSMTNTKTHDIKATLKQIIELKDVGCDLVRVAVFDNEDVDCLNELVRLSPLPIIADIHFNYQFALKAIDAGVFKIRLNPGNINKQEEILAIIKKAKEKGTWIRIGVNSGSIPKELLEQNNQEIDEKVMIAALDNYLKLFQQENFDKLVISLKCSDPILNEKVNLMASKKFSYPIHIGVTEAGPYTDAIIKSTIGLSNLLRNNIASTIRISISDDPVKEVIVARKILNHLNLRKDMVNIIACPTCGRLNYNMFEVVNEIEKYCQKLFFNLNISILGCIVNGIGEGMHADIGLAGSGNKVLIFEKGKIIKSVDSQDAINEFKKLIDKYYELAKLNK